MTATNEDTASTLMKLTHGILHELDRTVKAISEDAIDQLVTQIVQQKKAGRIFVAGAGRSGLMMRSFAMRLMHTGLQVYVVGETVTPALMAGDLLIIGSGSGETDSLVGMATKAKKLGASVALATVHSTSTIGQLADAVIVIPAASKEEAAQSSIQPMGSLFEQTLLLLFDAVVLRCMDRLSMDAAAMYNRHANLE